METRKMSIICIHLLISLLFVKCGMYTQYGKSGIGLTKTPTEDTKSDFNKFIKKEAPGEESYFAVQSVARLYIQEKQWRKAASVFETYRPYFPAKEKHFDDIIHLLYLRYKQSNFSKDFLWEEGKSFTNPKIKLKSKKIIKGKDVTVCQSKLGIIDDSYPFIQFVDPDEVEEVLVPSRNSTLYGLAIGTLVGFGALSIIKNVYEYRKEVEIGSHVRTTYGISGQPFHRSVTPIVRVEERKLDDVPSVLIVTLGIIGGVSIGSIIKSGWRNIFPSEEESLSLNFSVNNQSYNGAMVNFVYRF